jgi:hypothetical protein
MARNKTISSGKKAVKPFKMMHVSAAADYTVPGAREQISGGTVVHSLPVVGAR